MGKATAYEIQYGDVDLAALLRDLAEPYASRAEQAELNFNLKIEPDTVNIRGDVAQLGVLIHNLLDNAIKFTPEGGTVSVRLRREGEWPSYGSRTPGSASPQMICRISSAASIAGATLLPTPAAGWGCQSSRLLPRCAAARWRRRALKVGRDLRYDCR